MWLGLLLASRDGTGCHLSRARVLLRFWRVHVGLGTVGLGDGTGQNRC